MAGTLTFGFYSNQKIAVEIVIDVISYRPVDGVMHQHFLTVILNSMMSSNCKWDRDCALCIMMF